MSEPDSAVQANAADHAAETAAAQAFIAKWQASTATELASAQTFVAELCDLLDLPKPDPAGDGSYTYEKPLTQSLGDGSSTARRIDCYKRGCFILEAKKLKNHSGKGFDVAMLQARAQAENYARALPAAEGRPPFLIVVDVGHVFELYAEFSRTGGTYTPFPDPRHHRLPLQSLAEPATRELLRAVWTQPDTLDPAKRSAKVTREVSDALAGLATSLEADGHAPKTVAAFLTRCLFSMFAEDVELLPKGAFLGLLEQHHAKSEALLHLMRALWTDMDGGGFSVVLHQKLLKFNGKLFKSPQSDGYVLPLKPAQAAQLIAAARCNWREVEPAIFGTLLERALSSTERHALGAHYTPRAYVERLVWPTVIEPLRADWANAQAAAVVLASEAKFAEARQEILAFHRQLCATRVLDPACGSGNFLYVTLEHMKRLEGEVLNQLQEIGKAAGDARDQQSSLLAIDSVGLQQFIGLELNERAAALADLVLWIGYLQWQIKTRGNRAVAEPVVHDYGNIHCQDAVLDWDDLEPARGANGELLVRWDGVSRKVHPVTGDLVPDETAVIPQWQYIRPRKATWPQAGFIVGNPPFIGAASVRAALGDGYAQALRQTWREVPESADFVMHW